MQIQLRSGYCSKVEMQITIPTAFIPFTGIIFKIGQTLGRKVVREISKSVFVFIKSVHKTGEIPLTL